MCAHVCVSEALPCSLGQDSAGLRLAALEESPLQHDRRHRQATLRLAPARHRLRYRPLPSVSLPSVAARVSAAKIMPLPGSLPSRSLGSNMRILTQHRTFPAYALRALDGLWESHDMLACVTVNGSIPHANRLFVPLTYSFLVTRTEHLGLLFPMSTH